jgi:shikimate dehydrogenase
MLLHQGAAAFTLWTGQPAPLEVMQAALEDARARGVTSAEGEGGTVVEPAPADAAASEPAASEPASG